MLDMNHPMLNNVIKDWIITHKVLNHPTVTGNPIPKKTKPTNRKKDIPTENRPPSLFSLLDRLEEFIEVA
jgi:hypothetical protein